MSDHKTHEEVKAIMLKKPGVKAAYDEQIRKEKIREIMEDWRRHEGVSSEEVARRMGISPPAVAKIERNSTRASINTLFRYAQACGIEHPQIPL